MDDNVMRHEYRPLSTKNQERIKSIKDSGLHLYRILDELGSSRELSLAKTHLEEAVMWATKHCTRWKALPTVECPTVPPTLDHAPTVLTLSTLRLIATRLKSLCLHPADAQIIVYIHTDMEPDFRGMPNALLSYQYQDADYEHEVGRVERFRIVVHPDLPRYNVEGVAVYPVTHVLNPTQGDPISWITYHTISSLS